ncbi:ABC transporter substrate-binding protein [Actinomadura sp. 7K507]|uniref:ABC transporter substrate-binding protein n=1 Tax=Actinomadura sp. 7K507 TaxID=2530365 RepID=UPI00104616AE|nr:ABC transporter substrate-binding protein [Actinomadura sp. 7K507]TDC76272.1 ABC transporter substrate-binding protein [Actinomadura sp. 7K507]
MAREMIKVTAGLTGLALGLTGCAGGGDDASAAGQPRDGGTLRIVGSSDVEHLDPTSVASVGAYGLARTFARTLFGTRASNDFQETIPVRPDVAARIPTRENGDVGKDRRTYTVRLRKGVQWNTSPPRPVTAHDFVRGFERLCNPASPSAGKGYFISTLKGMEEFCRGFGSVDAKDAAAMAAYQREHEIEGVRAKDDQTLVFKLKEPASDFLNLLTLPYTAAAPQEYDRYVPDSAELRQNTISNGPYRISKYEPGLSYLLTHNPVWRQNTDPLRERHVEKIQITLGQDSPETVQQQIEQEVADLAWDQPVPTSAIPRLRDDDRFAIRETPSSSPYLVFNTLSPSNGGALGKREVRQALQYAVDRSALIKIVGGPSVAKPLHTVIPPGNSGYAPANHYPTPNESGNPAKCRELLGKAGHPDLTLKFPYRTNSVHKLIAQSLAGNLDACGVKTELSADSGGSFYAGTISTPANARAGEWDIAAPGWTPDWYGNNGRSIIQPLFDGRTYGQNSTNYGGYDNPEVNALIDEALTAPDPSHAGGYWQQADQKIMEDAAIVPLLNRSHTIFHSSRVHGAFFLPTTAGYDYTRLWLTDD